MAPVSLGVQVAEVEGLLLAAVDASDSAGDLTSDKSRTATRRFVIEENAVSGEHAVGLAVVDDDPVGVLLGDAVGRAGIERGGLRLGNLLDLSKELGSGGLIEAGEVGQPARADGVEQTEGTDAVHLGGVLGHLERNLIE